MYKEIGAIVSRQDEIYVAIYRVASCSALDITRVTFCRAYLTGWRLVYELSNYAGRNVELASFGVID